MPRWAKVIGSAVIATVLSPIPVALTVRVIHLAVIGVWAIPPDEQWPVTFAAGIISVGAFVAACMVGYEVTEGSK